jgi:ADP-ribose pyrophosphatase
VSERLFSGEHLAVERRDGKEVVIRGAAVAVVAVDREDRVLLVRQERVGAGGRLLELPAGYVDGEERPVDAARRELREETGLHGGVWTELASVYTTPGFCDERMHLFHAGELDEGEPDPDPSEDLELVRLPVADVSGVLPEIADAKTLAGLLLLLRLR